MYIIAYPTNFEWANWKVCSYSAYLRSETRQLDYHEAYCDSLGVPYDAQITTRADFPSLRTPDAAIMGNHDFVIARLAQKLADMQSVTVQFDYNGISKLWQGIERDFWQLRLEARREHRLSEVPAGAFEVSRWADGVFIFTAFDASYDGEWRRVALVHPLTQNGRIAKKWKACPMYGLPITSRLHDKWFNSISEATDYFKNNPHDAAEMWRKPESY